MITEQALLDVRPGREPEFEAAFAQAQTIIASMPGFASLRLLRCLEMPHRYLLLVEWERLEDHTEGFRGSPAYESGRRCSITSTTPSRSSSTSRSSVEEQPGGDHAGRR